MPNLTTIACPGGSIQIAREADGRAVVTVRADDPALFIPRPTVRTGYPDDLIAAIAADKGVAYTCDEIARDEDPGYTEGTLRAGLLSHFGPAELAGGTIVDFG